MHFLVPHEEIDKAMADTPVEHWTSLKSGSGLERTVQNWAARVGIDVASNDIAAFGVWSDAAPYHTRDSLYLVLVNVLSGVFHSRFWMCAWGKRLACNCGCKGKCTYDAVWRVLRWSMQCYLSGVYPSVRDDGVPFSEA